MQFSIRTALAWLLLLAIPLQGFATTGMVFCGPGHHGVLGAAAPVRADILSLDSSEGTAHEHSGAHPSSHHENKSNVSSSASTDVDDIAFLGKATPLKAGKADGKCSACAACCAGSALVSAPAMNAVATTGSDSIPFIAESFVNYVPEGLDPPPRSFLA